MYSELYPELYLIVKQNLVSMYNGVKKIIKRGERPKNEGELVPIYSCTFEKAGASNFPLQEYIISRKVKAYKGFRIGVQGYAAQTIPQIDAEIAEKCRFLMETS